jgi:hypothetical protein
MTTAAEHRKRAYFGPGAWKRLARWLKKHKRAVTIVSAVTVLASFVVKDGLDEPAKSVVSAVAQSERGRDEAQSGIGMWTQLVSINENLALVRGKLVEGKPIGETDVQLSQARANYKYALTLIGANFGALQYQKEVLPQRFRDEADKFGQDYQELLQRSGAAGGDTSIASLTQFSADWQKLSDRSRDLVGRGMKATSKLGKRAEFEHHVYQWVSYSLFFLGWTVGLASNLAGGKVDSAAG